MPLRHGGDLLRDTRNLSIGQGIKLILQAIYFVLIARALVRRPTERLLLSPH